jgi:glycosyltransferase involved in cell wall biosynthesis
MPSAVWLSNNITHYHRARAEAFAAAWPGVFTLLELSDRDNLSVLRGADCTLARRITLYPGNALESIPRRHLRASLVDALEEIRPDVCCLNGWGLPGTVVMLHWAIRRNVPCVLMSESNAHDAPRVWWKDAVKRSIVNHCNAAFVGGSCSRHYVNWLGMAHECIFDGYDVIDNEHFRLGAERARAAALRMRDALGVPSEYFVVCARFEEKKNLHRLIRGYAEYVSQTAAPPWSLVIAGDGPSRLELQMLARNLEVHGRVIFKGLVGYHDLPSLYGLAKAMVHPSTTEQWGLVVNEAMAAGVPVLVSKNCGCVPDLVKEGVNGFGFNPWKVEEITGALLAAHRNEDRLRQMGRESSLIIKEWDVNRFARNLRKAIDLALDSRHPRTHPFSQAIVWAMSLQ